MEKDNKKHSSYFLRTLRNKVKDGTLKSVWKVMRLFLWVPDGAMASACAR